MSSIDEIRDIRIKKLELLNAQKAAAITIKQQEIQNQIDADSIELEHLKQTHSLKFGYEKELLDRISAAKKEAIDKDAKNATA